jgi:hypothetical protein
MEAINILVDLDKLVAWYSGRTGIKVVLIFERDHYDKLIKTMLYEFAATQTGERAELEKLDFDVKTAHPPMVTTDVRRGFFRSHVEELPYDQWYWSDDHSIRVSVESNGYKHFSAICRAISESFGGSSDLQ